MEIVKERFKNIDLFALAISILTTVVVCAMFFGSAGAVQNRLVSDVAGLQASKEIVVQRLTAVETAMVGQGESLKRIETKIDTLKR